MSASSSPQYPELPEVLGLGVMNEEFPLGKSTIVPTNAEDLDLDSFFRMAIVQHVSDIHLRVGQTPIFRKNGKMVHTRLPIVTPKAMQNFAKWLIPEPMRPAVSKRHDVDFSLDFHGARLRVNMLYELGNLAFVIRVIPAVIRTLDELGLPEVLLDFTNLRSGLVLITGATGAGKSTTLASLLHHINNHQAKHIITLEDPVEYVYRNNKSVITQRQLGIDTPNFHTGIKQALRQDPDVLLIGEMRDRETAFSAIKAAETGALVFSTLHTSDAIQTINRIIDFFDPHEREAIRMQLANILKGTVSQRLFKPKDAAGMRAVAEVLMITTTVRDYLLRNDLDEIYALMDEGRFEGMQTMNYVLFNLLENEEITLEDALFISNNPVALQQRLKGGYHGANMNS